MATEDKLIVEETWISKPIVKIIIISISVLLVLLGFGYAINNNSNNESNMSNITTQENGLIIEDVQVGDGGTIESGDTASFHYEGFLEDGTKFDSSRDREEPFEITVGIGEVIQGWDQGLVGMKIGGKRKLTIPPELGYGDREIPGVIPANSTLIFDVEAVSKSQ